VEACGSSPALAFPFSRFPHDLAFHPPSCGNLSSSTACRLESFLQGEAYPEAVPEPAHGFEPTVSSIAEEGPEVAKPESEGGSLFKRVFAQLMTRVQEVSSPIISEIYSKTAPQVEKVYVVVSEKLEPVVAVVSEKLEPVVAVVSEKLEPVKDKVTTYVMIAGEKVAENPHVQKLYSTAIVPVVDKVVEKFEITFEGDNKDVVSAKVLGYTAKIPVDSKSCTYMAGGVVAFYLITKMSSRS